MNQIITPVQNLLVIDSQVSDWQSLVADVGTDTAVLILDSGSDGLSQISNYLTTLAASTQDFVPLQSLQIISHGNAGSLLLGSSTLTSDNLKQYTSQLASIGSSLTATGDILLYGCNVAQGEAGVHFIDSLAQYTGIDVAASNDLTGNMALGGNWQLEVSTGSIETPPAFTAASQQSYNSVLLADDYAGNTTTTGRVTIGGSVTGDIYSSLDHDWFKVDLVAGTRYVFDLSGLDSGGGTLRGTPYLSLYNPQGSYINGTALGGLAGDPRTSYTPTVSGTYYLDAGEVYDYHAGTYTLKASVATTADDYADNTSTTGRVIIGGSVTGNIDLVKDVDWFKVDLVAGTRYVFDLSGLHSGGGTLGANVNPYLRLYNPQGSYIDGRGIGGRAVDPRISYTPTASGTYYLEVLDEVGAQTGTYTLKASVAMTTDDYGDSYGAGGEVIVGGSVTGTIEAANDADWFKVYLVAGTRYVFDLSGLDSGGGTLGANSGIPSLVLYDRGGSGGHIIDSTVSGGLGGDPRMSYTPTISGTYWLQASELGEDQTGTYTLKASVANVAVIDTTPPTITDYSPADGNTNAALASNIVLTFSEAIQKGAGLIQLHSDSATGTVIESFDAVSSNRLALSGNTLTIDPTNNLANSSQYFVTFDSGTIKDLAGNNYAGISSYDFTTVSAETNGDDSIKGTGSDDVINALAGNDSIHGSLGNDHIDGGTGNDTVIYDFNKNAVIEVGRSSDGALMIKSAEGTDTLLNIENLSFLDGGLSINELLAQSTPVPLFTSSASDGTSSYVMPTKYAGPVTFLEYQLLGNATGDVITGSTNNDFINLLGGDDAANGGAGDDVLDGGTGSNFLTGGSGNDTIFLDGRGGTTTWSTVTDFSAGDQVNIWGWNAGVSKQVFAMENQGADGYKGATFHYDFRHPDL